MSVEKGTEGYVHHPKRRDVFQFDDEVAKVFDDMAPRSIPMYNEVHRMHLSMLRHRLVPGAVVVDVGSSTGRLFRGIESQMGSRLPFLGMDCVAIDSSEPMMDRLRADYPTVTTIVADLALLPEQDIELPEADLLFCLYTLQFVHTERKNAALEWLVSKVKLGGYLILGQKERILYPELEKLASEEYYHFRRDNGYTQEEIDAKTAALKGSMWPSTHYWLMDTLYDLGFDAIETSRWLEFSTVLGVRRR